MLCEKCKNRKATVFYADEGGGRHSLCAACASGQGKTERFPVPAETASSLAYVPQSALTALSPSPLPLSPFDSIPKDLPATCPKCGIDSTSVLKNGILGCPDCYDLYVSLFPFLAATQTDQGKMPYSRRKKREKDREIAELRRQIKQAVEKECYEQAASLRDRIKALETSSNT